MACVKYDDPTGFKIFICITFQEEIRSFRCSLNERQPIIEDTLLSGRAHLATVGHALLTEMQLNPSDASGNDSGKKFVNKRVVTSTDLWR